LNFGDVGVKTLFLKAYDQLTDDGLFIIDPQPWKSYKKNKKLSAVTQDNFNHIQLKPNLFKEYLEAIGFKLLQTI
jgi:7SK snRNA methylphosphate capping enzyme